MLTHRLNRNEKLTMFSENFPDHLSCFSFRNSFTNASLLLVVHGGDEEEIKEVILAKNSSLTKRKDKIKVSHYITL